MHRGNQSDAARLLILQQLHAEPNGANPDAPAQNLNSSCSTSYAFSITRRKKEKRSYSTEQKSQRRIGSARYDLGTGWGWAAPQPPSSYRASSSYLPPETEEAEEGIARARPRDWRTGGEDADSDRIFPSRGEEEQGYRLRLSSRRRVRIFAAPLWSPRLSPGFVVCSPQRPVVVMIWA